MKIIIQLNQYSTLSVEATDINSAQLIFQTEEMQKVMPNPTTLPEYLELNDPSFLALTIEYFEKDNDNAAETLRAMMNHKISTQMFLQYLAHCFEIHQSQITLEI